MNYNRLFPKADRAGFALSAAILVTTLTGCSPSNDTPPPPAQSGAPAAANDVPAQASEAPPAQGAEPAFATQDDYVYYPAYNLYYSSHLHKYASLEGGVWVSRPAPRGVSVKVVEASPSVKMDFHDSPAKHHEEVIKKYPKDWAPDRR